jgi:hypothetical protein
MLLARTTIGPPKLLGKEVYLQGLTLNCPNLGIRWGVSTATFLSGESTMQLASRFASRSPVLRADHPLSDDQIRTVAPSIFAEDKHASRSERYSYIPTAAVLTELRQEGFQPFMVCQTRVRQEDRRDYTKHLIRLRHASQINGAEANEIILLNSHDGTSTYLMLIVVCHHWRDSTCYPAYLPPSRCRGAMVTVVSRETQATKHQ